MSVKIDGKSVIDGKDYTIRNGVITILNESLLPVRTIEYVREYKPNRAQRRAGK